MAEPTPPTVRQVFAGLIPDELTKAYERLLSAGAVPQKDAAGFFGADGTLEALTSLGMATVYAAAPDRPALAEPVDPDLAILGVLNDMHDQAADLHQRLTIGTRRAAEAHGMRRTTHATQLAEILTDREEIIRVSGAIINDAFHDFMELENLNKDIPISETMVTRAPGSLATRITHRLICDQALLQDKDGWKYISKAVAAGQQIRWRPEIHMKMQIADTSRALVALTLTGTSGALLIRSEQTVRALREYFELLWNTSVPVGGHAPGGDSLADEDREILSLHAAGLPHDRVAERTGKSSPTVRRHVAAMYRQLGATTPFQAGAEALRRGWIP